MRVTMTRIWRHYIAYYARLVIAVFVTLLSYLLVYWSYTEYIVVYAKMQVQFNCIYHNKTKKRNPRIK